MDKAGSISSVSLVVSSMDAKKWWAGKDSNLRTLT